MTEQQATALAKALDRAHANGLQVRGHGTLKLAVARFLAIDSATLPNVWHIVVIRDGHLECDCEASKFGKLCKHRALAHKQLVAERAAVLASERWALTEKGKAAVAEQRTRRESSLPRQRGAFSLMK
jgi:hypothetical protein